jgi:hypothetical protein
MTMEVTTADQTSLVSSTIFYVIMVLGTPLSPLAEFTMHPGDLQVKMPFMQLDRQSDIWREN